LRLVDQTAAGMTGAQFVISGQTVNQGGSVNLSSGTYALTVMPPINGQASGALLRVDSVSVGAVDTLITVLWYYADLTVRLVDQTAAADDSAEFSVPGRYGPGRDGIGTTTYHLPVTVEQPGDSTYQGVLAGGYDVEVFPSINGKRQGSQLLRFEAVQE